MDKDLSLIVPFLVRAKRVTYASSDEPAALDRVQQPSSRPNSHDLAYREGDLLYLDTYLGGFSFAGEEAVWRGSEPLWGMNYYGTMYIEDIPEGFSAFLKLCLRQVSEQAPFRGPDQVQEGRYAYTCSFSGDMAQFRGEEAISLEGEVIYTLVFHGGSIR